MTNFHLCPSVCICGKQLFSAISAFSAVNYSARRGSGGVVLLLGSLAACCLTPLLPGMIRSVVDYSTHDVMVRSGTIAEFRPFYSGIMGNVSAAFVAVLWIGVILHRIRPPRFPLGEMIWLAGGTALLFLMGRLSPVFAIIAAPAFAATIPRLSDRILARPPVVTALAVVLAISIWPVVRGFPRPDESLSSWLNRHGPDAPNYPCLAADFVDRNVPGQSHRLLCDWTWGGFLEWRLGNRFQTLMDGRTQLFTPEFWDRAALGSPRPEETIPFLHPRRRRRRPRRAQFARPNPRRIELEDRLSGRLRRGFGTRKRIHHAEAANRSRFEIRVK